MGYLKKWKRKEKKKEKIIVVYSTLLAICVDFITAYPKMLHMPGFTPVLPAPQGLNITLITTVVVTLGFENQFFIGLPNFE